MGDSLTIFGTAYTGVNGIKAKGTGNGTLTYVRPTGTLSVTQNGTVDVTNYASASVNVSGGSSASVQPLVVTPSTSQQVFSSGTKQADDVYARAYREGAGSGYWSKTLTVGETYYVSVRRVDSGGNVITIYDTVTWTCTSSSSLIFGIFYGTDTTFTVSGTTGWMFSANVYEGEEIDGFLPVTVESIPSGYIIPTGSKSITANGTGIDVAAYASVDVSVSGSAPNLQAKTNISPTTSSQTITADSGYDGLSSVQINAMPSGSVSASATKGSVSNHAISVTPTATVGTAGYLAAGSTNGTAVSVAASELVSGTYTVDSSGTKDVTNYASASVPAMTLPTAASGTASGTRKATIASSTSTQYINIPTGFNGAAAYYQLSAPSAMTLPTSTSSTGSGTSKLAVTPGTANKYINIPTGYNSAAAYYTVNGDSNLLAENIKSGVSLFGVAGSYTGSGSGGSMNVQVAQSTSRATSSTYTNVCSLTCSTAGTYDIYWDCFRSSTGGTNGSQLYIGGSAHGSANTTFTNHVQTNHLTGVTLAKDQAVAVYARSRGNNYYAYVGQLTIVQTA